MLEKKLWSFWESVIWSDASKFNLFGSDGKVMVWRTPREEFDPKCTVPTVKHSGGSVMVWGCFTSRGVGKLCVLDLIMDRFYYRDILEQNLLPSIDHFKFGQQSHFMHDNDPKHTSGLVNTLVETENNPNFPMAIFFTGFKSHREFVGWTWTKSQKTSTEKSSRTRTSTNTGME